MIKKIIYVLLSLALLTGLMLLLGFTANSYMQTPVHHMEIQVSSRSGNHFIGPEHIRSLVIEHFDTLEGRHLQPELLRNLHGIIHNIAQVDHARVYRTINGELKVDITLRDPMIRIINQNNQSFYLDTQGNMFPLATGHTARVMLATGRIAAAYSPGGDIFLTEAEDGDQGHKVLHGLFKLARYIHEDVFWNAFIDHIMVLPNGKFELIPKNGVHIIQFGDATDVEAKFDKLRAFYVNGLSKLGWYYYNRINVEFNQQIICSK